MINLNGFYFKSAEFRLEKKNALIFVKRKRNWGAEVQFAQKMLLKRILQWYVKLVSENNEDSLDDDIERGECVKVS